MERGSILPAHGGHTWWGILSENGTEVVTVTQGAGPLRRSAGHRTLRASSPLQECRSCLA